MQTLKKLTEKEKQKIIKELDKKGYGFSRYGYIYPPIRELSEDYPWTFSGRRGPVTAATRADSNYPLPCAFFRRNNCLELLNGWREPVKKYHKEIRKILGID